MSSLPHPELREFHRIRYPFSERPTFLHGGKSHPVIDVSARGLRYAVPGGTTLKPHDPIEGILRFRRGAPIDIVGTVVRIQGDQVAIRLNHEISNVILIAEQRYLHARYPMWS